MAKDRAEELSEDEKRALRGSKFAPLPSLPPPRSQPRLAHPGGPLTTNKAVALAKFLERKLQDPDGLGTMNPQLVERAVQNAKRTVFASAASNSQGRIRHVNSFGDSESEDPLQEEEEEENVGNSEPKKKKKNKKKKKKKNKQKCDADSGGHWGCCGKKAEEEEVKIVIGRDCDILLVPGIG